jgi:hypothetical protein
MRTIAIARPRSQPSHAARSRARKEAQQAGDERLRVDRDEQGRQEHDEQPPDDGQDPEADRRRRPEQPERMVGIAAQEILEALGDLVGPAARGLAERALEVVDRPGQRVDQLVELVRERGGEEHHDARERRQREEQPADRPHRPGDPEPLEAVGPRGQGQREDDGDQHRHRERGEQREQQPGDDQDRGEHDRADGSVEPSAGRGHRDGGLGDRLAHAWEDGELVHLCFPARRTPAQALSLQ